MLRGYRFLIIASGLAALFIAFGLGAYAGGLNYPKQQRYQEYNSGNGNEGGAKLPVSSNLTGSVVKRIPCHNPNSEGESDLCAQWKAANAAEDSAFWTKWGFWIAVIGSSFLLWQIMLTREAVKDTGDATRAMRQANEIAKIGADAAAKAFRLQAASSRPLVIFDIENALFEGPPFEGPWGDPKHRLDHHISSTFSFKNIGSQPCWIESAWLTFYIKERDYMGGTSDTGGTIILPDGLNDWFRVANSGFIQPGQSIDCGGGFLGVQKAEIEIIEKGGGVVVFGMCQYRSLAGSIHCTRYAFHVPIQRPHNKSLDRGHPVANPAYWRDGLVKAAKLEHSDPISWIGEQ